ncbi:MAG TPA: hypothetical protein DIW20_02570 [Rhodospirillaceae bacterium]|nr:hypothetical protein [Rhodospirillaceae bacterium]
MEQAMDGESTIQVSFVKDYDKQVKVAYQREGSLLANTVRKRKNVVGDSVRFQKYGFINAVGKTRNGDLEFQNPDHSYVEAAMVDRYAPVQVDDLDQLATNNDEQALAAQSGAWALGRETDSQIITALSGASQYVGDYSKGLNKSELVDGLVMLDNKKVPNKGRFAALWPKHFYELINIAEVSSSDYVGDKFPWLKGEEAFYWNGTMWIKHSGLLTAEGDATHGRSYIWHQMAAGHGSGADVSTRIDWDTRAQAYNIVSKMKGGAALIEEDGVVELRFALDEELDAA